LVVFVTTWQAKNLQKASNQQYFPASKGGGEAALSFLPVFWTWEAAKLSELPSIGSQRPNRLGDCHAAFTTIRLKTRYWANYHQPSKRLPKRYRSEIDCDYNHLARTP
jgi:hypothetical protein